MIEHKGKHPIELIHPRSLKYTSHKLQHFLQKRLWLKVIIAMLLGILVGLLLNPTTGLVAKETGLIFSEWIVLPGVIFLALIQMIVIPLIFASIIRGIAASENINQLKKSGVMIALYFIGTTIVAILIGLSLAFLIQPGQYINTSSFDIAVEANIDTIMPSMNIQDLVLGVIPTNVFSAMTNMQFLQIIVFAIIFGIALVNMNPNQSKPLLELLGSLQSVCITIVKWAMILVPVAVFGFTARAITQFGFDVLLGMGVYILTVLIGLGIMMLFYLTIIFFTTGMSPTKYLSKIKNAQLLAFSTSSSAATMPYSMKTAEERLGIRSSIAQFIIPIGATINMDGTAMYQTIAVIFLAQVFGINLALTAIILIIITVVGSSIGAPGTPGVGIVILSAILASIGIPLAGIALLIGFDRILDMFRTTINVTGDLTAAVVINKFVKSDMTREQQIKHESSLEKERKSKGTDVVIAKHSQVFK